MQNILEGRSNRGRAPQNLCTNSPQLCGCLCLCTEWDSKETSRVQLLKSWGFSRSLILGESWSSGPAKLKRNFRLLFETLGGPCLRSKPRIEGYILGLRCKSKNKLILIKFKTKPAEDQDDPPVIYLCVRTKFHILWRKITKSSTYHPQCLVF